MHGRTPDASRSFDDHAPQRWPDDADRRPGGQQLGERVGDRRRRAAGSRSSVVARNDDVRKGKRAKRVSARNGGAVKLTTALWYTPSGRSINRMRRDERRRSPPDTRAASPAYKTDAGRKVLGGGGITPDVVASASRRSPRRDTAFRHALGTQVPKFRDALTDYALSLKATGAVTSPDFVVTPAMRAELLRRMESRGVTVDASTYERASTPGRSAARLRDRAIRVRRRRRSTRGGCMTTRLSAGGGMIGGAKSPRSCRAARSAPRYGSRTSS